jgi:hypothetical protein
VFLVIYAPPVALSQALAIDIPEADYGRLGSLGECRRYLAGRIAPQ